MKCSNTNNESKSNGTNEASSNNDQEFPLFNT